MSVVFLCMDIKANSKSHARLCKWDKYNSNYCKVIFILEQSMKVMLWDDITTRVNLAT